MRIAGIIAAIVLCVAVPPVGFVVLCVGGMVWLAWGFEGLIKK